MRLAGSIVSTDILQCTNRAYVAPLPFPKLAQGQRASTSMSDFSDFGYWWPEKGRFGSDFG
jgi:hypothetical protein